MKLRALFFYASLLTVVGCGRDLNFSNVQEPWDSENDPIHLGSDFKRSLDTLPIEGQLDEAKKPWSDSYWPSMQGGISARWYDGSQAGFDYALSNRATVKQMTSAELKRLSPAEKYDIYQGRYDYPLVKAERSRTNRESPSWEGLCHGWAAAALNYVEPKPVVVKNRDGIEVPFGASDLKALLIFYQGEISRSGGRFLGARCEAEPSDDGAMRDPACRDVNAGSFHIVLANMLGLRKQGFVMDKSRSVEVWNHPVFGFKATLGEKHAPSPGAATNAVEEVDVRAEVKYASEISPQWEPVLGTRNQYNATAVYSYRVELDAEGNIVGGEWLENDRPDFLWTRERGKLSGYFANLEKLMASEL